MPKRFVRCSSLLAVCCFLGHASSGSHALSVGGGSSATSMKLSSTPSPRVRQPKDNSDQSLFYDPLDPESDLVPPLSASQRKRGQEGSLRAGAGALLASAIIVSLAFTNDEIPSYYADDDPNSLIWDSLARGTMNVAGAAFPSSSTDLIAAALGESIGGIIGVVCGALVTMVGVNARSNLKPLVTNLIADSDFFLANSASLPLLQAVGMSPAAASLASVILASIPSQLVKLGSRRSDQKALEDELLRQLLEEERLREEERRRIFIPPIFQNNEKSKSVEIDELKPAVDNNIDFVEVFSDVTRWLAYDVLKTDFGGMIVWDGFMLDTALTGALFGAIAAISSQLYADVLYIRFQYGSESRQQEVRSRTKLDWAAIYAAKAASTAVLFGVYEFSQGPISRWIQGTLAGGVDGCFGSSSFDICMQTYINTNAPGPSAEAQLRALVTNLNMVGVRLQDIAVDTTFADIQALLQTWIAEASMNLMGVF